MFTLLAKGRQGRGTAGNLLISTPPPLSFPTPGKTVPHHPLGDGHQVTVPHPWGTALPPDTHICRHRNCNIKRKNSA